MDHQLAITQGVDFLAFTRNAADIALPDGRTVLGPLDIASLPHLAGDYAIRLVVVDGPEPGPQQIGGTEPPVVGGDVVVVRRTVTPMSAELVAARAAQAKLERRADIETELASIDAASARPLRAIIAGTATQADRDRLVELEGRATALRDELAALPPPAEDSL